MQSTTDSDTHTRVFSGCGEDPDLAQCLRNTVVSMISEDEGVILANGYEVAFAGIARIPSQNGGTVPVAVYDRDSCVKSLIVLSGMTMEEAEDFFFGQHWVRHDRGERPDISRAAPQ